MICTEKEEEGMANFILFCKEGMAELIRCNWLHTVFVDSQILTGENPRHTQWKDGQTIQ